MAIILATVFVWLFTALLLVARKGMNVLETLFVLILIIIANQIYCTYIQANLKWVEAYETVTAEVVINLQRTIIFPLVTTLLINLHFTFRRVLGRIIIFAFFITMVLLLEGLCAYYEILMYKQNRWIIPILQAIVLYGVGLVSLYIYRPIVRKDIHIS